MRKTPSALKWLVEKRARLANDVAQTGALAAELTHRHATLQAQLAALDATIRLYDGTLDPTSIAPIAAWQGRFGKRGALREALIEILRGYSPHWVASATIGAAFIAKYGITFVSPAHRKRWHKQSFGSALLRLANEGVAERLHDPEAPTGKHGHWRLMQSATPRLADL